MPYSANTFVDMLQSSQAAVIVKPTDSAEYTVQLPRRLLTTNSAYLERALSSEWQATKQGGAMAIDDEERLPTVELDVPSARACNILTFYLYRQELPSLVDDEGPAGDDDGADASSESRSLVRDWLEIWMLFDRLLMPMQQNEVMTKLCAIAMQSLREDNLINPDDVKLVAEAGNFELTSFALELVMLCSVRGTWTADQAREVMEAHGMMSGFLECAFNCMKSNDAWLRDSSNICWWTKGDRESALWKNDGRPK